MADSDVGELKVIDGHDCIVTKDGEAGFLLFGPYRTYAPGRYSVEFRLMVSEGSIGTRDVDTGDVCGFVEVVSDMGGWIIARRQIRRRQIGLGWTGIRLEFFLEERARLEFRLYSNGHSGLVVDEDRSVTEPVDHPNQFHDNSQNGETRILLRKIIERAVSNTFLVDVGAYGRSGSNSYDLMFHFGWSGLLIEANPVRCERIDRDFNGSDYTLLNAAVSDKEGDAILYLGVHDELSSISREKTGFWGDIRDAVPVSMVRLPQVLKKNSVPHEFGLLSVDAEGEDVTILNDVVAEGYRPQWIIFEGALNFRSLEDLGLSETFRENYRFMAKTSVNLILERAT